MTANLEYIPISNYMKNLTGQRFGRLVALAPVRLTPKRTGWECICDCGNIVISETNKLTSGHTHSCSCLQKDTVANNRRIHGMTRTRTYRIWQLMRDRCKNPKNPNYKNYGGRGITVCRRWSGANGFPSFFADMGEILEPFTIERIDNDKGYSPNNCKLATKEEQANNTRQNIHFTHNGKTKTLAQWVKSDGVVSYGATLRRLSLGWTFEDALITPPRVKYKNHVYVTRNGQTKNLSEWCRSDGRTTYDTFLKRLESGYSFEKALTTPKGKLKRG